MINDTIVALSTAPLESALGVIRISGDKAFNVLEEIFNKKVDLKSKREILFGKIIDKENSKIIDEVLVSVFKGPHSFTGEDTVEISCHGGLVVINKILQLCYAKGARPAERGEFSKKAFFNGKIDLIQAESINDLITAKSELAAEIAVSGLKGNVSSKIQKVREKLVEILSHIEVNIDYPEYQDIEEITENILIPLIKPLEVDIKKILSEAQTGRLIRDGIKVAIIGKPNAGKSSLLNALIEENKAIVTDIEGTTRDVVEGRVVINGLPFNFLDTAGIRKPKDLVEKIGVEKSKEAINNADLVLIVISSEESFEEAKSTIEQFKTEKPYIVVLNKNDISKLNIEGSVSISAKENDISQLKEAIVKKVGFDLKEYNDFALLSNARQIGLMQKVYTSLTNALIACEELIPVDLICIDMKDALNSIDELLGQRSDIENEIFSRFCIGK